MNKTHKKTIGKYLYPWRGILGLILFFSAVASQAQITVTLKQTQLPVIVDRANNIIAEIEIDNSGNEPAMLNNLFLTCNYNKKDFTPRAVRVFYTGSMSVLYNRTKSWALKEEFRRIGGSQQVFASPRYAIQKNEIKVFDDQFPLAVNQPLIKGKNYFFISLEVDKYFDLSTTFELNVEGYELNNKKEKFDEKAIKHRLAIGLRNYQDDGAFSYRIPGLATTNNGTLIATYDVRYQSKLDLQEDIDVAISRSSDGGRSWEKMKIVIDMGEWGGLPQAQNGVGDPCILVDSKTNDIYIFALWTHGMDNNIAWRNSKQGMTPQETGQLIYVKSSDDGRTWGKPVNITEQVKDPSWRLLLQGPGRAITMQDGTLVVPIQYIDSANIPNASIMYSTDRGQTWKTHKHPQPNTTEAQVVELASGELMLNMRDNRGGSRSIFTTSDFGQTWTEHPSSRKALQEPVCMASLLNVRKKGNVLNWDILLFSNPNESERPNRRNMTIKASLDQGMTWDATNQLLIDEEWGWGYSCLTMIDKETVGILYEGSTSQLIFQAVKLTDILKNK